MHIGRHKTGTTAIQQFLRHNKQWLLDNGFYTPETGLKGLGHHDIAIPMRRVSINRLKFYKHSTVLKNLQAEIHDNKNLTSVISSEAFQNSSPKIVHKAFRDFEVRIVVYLRNQLDYLVGLRLRQMVIRSATKAD